MHISGRQSSETPCRRGSAIAPSTWALLPSQSSGVWFRTAAATLMSCMTGKPSERDKRMFSITQAGALGHGEFDLGVLATGALECAWPTAFRAERHLGLGLCGAGRLDPQVFRPQFATRQLLLAQRNPCRIVRSSGSWARRTWN